MTTVSEYEHGLVRVFLLDAALRAQVAETGTYDAVCAVLGIARLNSDDVQILETETLGGMLFADFLRDGYEANEDDLAEYKFQLDAVSDTDAMVLVVRSGAFVDRPATLIADGAANLIATLREPDAKMPMDKLPNPDPDAVLDDKPVKKRPSDAAMSGRIATIALLVMALLVWLMIWIAG